MAADLTSTETGRDPGRALMSGRVPERRRKKTHTHSHTHMLLANEADTKLPFAFLEVVYRKPRPSATAVSLQTDTQRDTQGDCVRNHLQL